MYYRGSFFFRTLAVLLMVGFLVLGAALIFQAGRATGYSLGLASGSAEVLIPGAQPIGMFPSAPFMILLALLCLGGMSFLFFFAMMGIFGRKRWQAYGRHKHTHDWDAAHTAHWGTPPWWRERKPDEPSPGAAESQGQQNTKADDQASADA